MDLPVKISTDNSGNSKSNSNSSYGTGEGDTFLSPKRKRLLSPHCAHGKGENILTHVPSHRNWSELQTTLDVGFMSEGNRISSPVRSTEFTNSPETATFLRRAHLSEHEGYNKSLYKYGGVKKKDIFEKYESTYSTDDERDNSIRANDSADRDVKAARFDEMKRDCSVRHDGDGDGDTGAESDFSGVAGRMSTLSVGKRHSAFRGPQAKRPSPLSSPSSSQNSSLNNSIILSPNSFAPRECGVEHKGSPGPFVLSSLYPVNDQSDPLSSMYSGTMQPGRRPKVSKMVASAILNRSAVEGGRGGHSSAPVASPSRPVSDGAGSTPLHLLEQGVASVNNTHISAFRHGSGMANHSNTELLYSYHQDEGDNFSSVLMEDTINSKRTHSSASFDRHAQNMPCTPFVSTQIASRVATPEAASQSRVVGWQGDPFSESAPRSYTHQQQAHLRGANSDTWDIRLPHEAGTSPVLTPTHSRRSRTEPGTQSQSLSMSQQSYHEEAMGDLGTPVTEIGSPAVIDGIDDLVDEDDDENVSLVMTEGRPLGRALFSGPGAGSLFEDEPRQEFISEAKVDWKPERAHFVNNEQDDPEIAQLSAMHTSLSSRSLPPVASGMKHALEHRDIASSVGSSGGSGVHRPHGHIHQRIRTYSPFMNSDDQFDSRDASFLQDEDEHEYHLFAQQFMCSPTNADLDDGRSRSPFTIHLRDVPRSSGNGIVHSKNDHSSKQVPLDFSGDTTGVMSDTRSASDFLNLSKSSSSESDSHRFQQDSCLMDTSVGSTGSTRPLPDQSAFDGSNQGDLSRSSYANNSSTLQEPPFFGSPSSARKRRPHHSRVYSSLSSNNSPDGAALAPPTPQKGSFSWGSPGLLGSPQPSKATRRSEEGIGLRTVNLNLRQPNDAHSVGNGVTAILDYTPPPVGKSLVTHALGIAVPTSADTVQSGDSSESDILVHSWHNSMAAFDRSGSDLKAPPHPSSRMGASSSSSDPFLSLSHTQPRGPLPLVRQSSLMDNKVLLSQNEDERPVTYREDFEEVGLLGSGTFADVYKVRQRKGENPGAYFAVKKLKRQFRSKKDREWLMAEVHTMKLLGRKNACAYVVPFIRAWQEDSYFYVQMGFAERGTLRELMFHVAKLEHRCTIHSSSSSGVSNVGDSGLMPDNTVWHVVHDVCAGLQHIHACGYVHLDIKPANLLITESGTVQIGDFGMAVQVGRCEDGHEGDTRYMAEELLNNNERMPSADLFSLGLTLYEMCCFFDEDSTISKNNQTNHIVSDETSLRFTVRRGLPSNGPLWHTLREDRAPPLPPGRTVALQEVVSACMKSKPNERPSAAQVLLVQEVQDTLDDVDAMLRCAPRHSDSPRPPFLARSASMQEIDGLPSQAHPSGASVGTGTGIIGVSRIPSAQGLSIAVGPDNQIDYSSLGDGAFTPSFGHNHHNFSPR